MMWARCPKSNWSWLPYIALLMWLWFPLWFSDEVPAFRDGFHFYLPQLVWLNDCYQQGEFFPVWNPNEGLGSSVAGQPSWQLFYPFRLLWLTPWLSLPQKMAIFFGIHQMIAAAGILKASRVLQLSSGSSWFAAVCFSLSSPIVFQHTNMIYLCSAAWVGWTLSPILHLLKSHFEASKVKRTLDKTRQLAVFACACCLMFLGGDPHGAVNAAVIAFLALAFILFASLRWKIRDLLTNRAGPSISRGPSDNAGSSIGVAARSHRKNSGTSSPFEMIDPIKPWLDSNLLTILRSKLRSKILLITLAITIGWLTLAQLLATWSWYQFSSRAITDPEIYSKNAVVMPILVDESPVYLPAFDFSLSPWSLPSLIWPTIGGHYQPGHSRWVDALPSEGRMWIPSIYLGLLPVLLSISAIAQAWKNSLYCQRWLLLIIAFTMLCSMGGYSAGWLIRESGTALGFEALEETMPNDAQLSLYGALSHLIPGYDRFRYPAKWITWTIAGIALLSATRLETWTQQGLRINLLSKKILIIFLMSVAGLVTLYTAPLLFTGLSEGIQSWLSQADDRLLGPVDSRMATSSVSFALVWPIAILGIIVAGCLLPKSFQPGMLVVVTACELAICSQSHWIVTTAMPKISTPASAGRSESLVWANSRQARYQDFSEIHEDDPLSLQLLLSQTFLLGKLNHLDRKAALNASASLKPRPVAKLIRWLQANDDLAEKQPEIDQLLSYLGVTHRLIRNPSAHFTWQPVNDSPPLCELIYEGRHYDPRMERQPSAVLWHWENNQALSVTLEACETGYLIIRQINDGGWLLNGSGSTRDDLPTLEQNELFLVVPVQPGKHHLKLTRRNPLRLWN